MIVISEFMDELSVNKLRQQHQICYQPDLFKNTNELFALAKNCHALIVRNRTQVDQNLLSRALNLTCIGRLGVGLDNIDMASCAARNITVYPATGANDRSVAEYVITTSMALMRRAYYVNHQMVAGEWPRNQSAGSEIFGKTLGLIGFGSIGQRTAKLAAAVGMLPIAFDPFLSKNSDAWCLARKTSLSELLQQSDIISIHVPLTKTTHKLIAQEELDQLKSGAIVINTSRGGVVEENALIEALRNSRIGGVALDVFEHEPLSSTNGHNFSNLNNIILTPHIAGVTTESNQRVSELIAKKILAHLNSVR